MSNDAHTFIDEDTYIIVDKTNDKVIKTTDEEFIFADEMEAHDVAEHLACTYENTLFEVMPISELSIDRSAF